MSYRKLVIVLFSVFLVSAGCTGNNTAMVASAENGGGSGAGGGSTGGANPVNTVTAVANSASLPACTTATSGSIFFLLDELKYKYCNGTTYAYLVPSATPGSTFSLGGTYSGAALPSPVWLQRNASETMLITNPGAFTFPTALVDQTDYFVAISSQPTTGEYCVLNNNYGRILGASVSNLALDCKVPHFDFVDGNTATGLNNEPYTYGVATPTAIVHGGKLYVGWFDYDSATTSGRINIVVYNGNDAAPSWASVSAGLATFPSVNQGTLKFAIHNNKLYATVGLGEGPSCYGCGNTGGIARVLVYNGNDSAPSWTYIDNGMLNLNTANLSAMYAKLVSSAGKLYALWVDYTTSGTFGHTVRAAVYNDSDSAPQWTLVDGGSTDRGISTPIYGGDIGLDAIAHGGSIFAVYMEGVTMGSPILKVSRYNGNDAAPSWTQLDSSTIGGLARMAVFAVHGADLFLAWSKFGSTMTPSSLGYTISKFNNNLAAPAWHAMDNGATPFRWVVSTDPYCMSGCSGEYNKIALVSHAGNIWYNYGHTIGHYAGVSNTGHRWHSIVQNTSNDGTGLHSRFVWHDGSSMGTGNLQGGVMVPFNNRLYFVWAQTTAMSGTRIRVKKLTNF